jgi:diaminopimelate epimerase
MAIRFEKVQGLGNDFVVVDSRVAGELVSPAVARQLCDRRTGVGADGVLTLLPSRAGAAAARLHIYNADGSEAEMCGNGLRCVAKLLLEERPGPSVAIETPGGTLRCEVGPGGTIRAEIGHPEIGAPLELSVLGETVPGLPVSIGNPHFVIFGSSSEDAARRLGPALERHPHFAPGRTNVELCEVGRDSLKLSVWERGSGFTQACGTGACAAAVAAVHQRLIQAGAEIAVDLPGGRLFVTVAPELASVSLRGPAERVFSGELRSWPQGAS